jgi:hypothetical protein
MGYLQRHRKGRYKLSFKRSDFTLWRHTWRKNWVNCAVLTGNSAGLRTVLSSRLSHKVLCSSVRESHSFLSLPADTTMASSQDTSVSSNSFSTWASHDIFLCKYHFLLHILRFFTRARRHTNYQKTDKNWWETCAVPENIQFSFSCSFFTQLKFTV